MPTTCRATLLWELLRKCSWLHLFYFFLCTPIYMSAIKQPYVWLFKEEKKISLGPFYLASAIFDTRIYASVVPSKVVSPQPFKSTNTCDYEWCHWKAQVKYLLFQERRVVFFSSVGKCFPCVVASLTFERRFCCGGLCFLTSGSGVFWCWLWIISCNDGSAWHVCLDSMPSSLSTDQTELSYWL